jgi:hypothetical protein
MNRQAVLFFPPLHGANAPAQVRSDLFPGPKKFILLFWFNGGSGRHAGIALIVTPKGDMMSERSL